MNTGFKDLDKLINIERPQLAILTGQSLIDMLSGDIANDVCLEQGKEVLEIVSHHKEYLIKRLMVNEANVKYNKWTIKNQYTNTELKQIGQNIVDLVETTKRLPTIIEQVMKLYNLKNVAKYVSMWVNHYADREKVDSLIVLDIYPFNSLIKDKYAREKNKFMKKLQKISKKLTCTIILAYPNMKEEKPVKEEIKKYADVYIDVNVSKANDSIIDVLVGEKDKIIGTCKLIYDYEHRKFIDYEEKENK